MQKNGKKCKIGSYELELYPEETRACYERSEDYEGDDVSFSFFRYLLPRAQQESLDFFRELGIDWKKLYFARPLSEPDENGEILYYGAARLSGILLKGGDIFPRQSEEKNGLSVVFVGDPEKFQQGVMPVSEPQVEMRFVIPLPFDGSFFEEKRSSSL